MVKITKGILYGALIASIGALYFTAQAPYALAQYNFDVTPLQFSNIYFPLILDMACITGLLLVLMIKEIAIPGDTLPPLKHVGFPAHELNRKETLINCNNK